MTPIADSSSAIAPRAGTPRNKALNEGLSPHGTCNAPRWDSAGFELDPIRRLSSLLDLDSHVHVTVLGALLELLYCAGSHLRLPEIEFLEILQACELLEPLVGHLRSVKVEIFQCAQGLD